MQIKFTIFGRPQQRGSKVPVPKRGGGWIEKDGWPILKDANDKSRAWMDAVKATAADAYRGELLRGPIGLELVFYFKRPSSHFGSGRNVSVLKPSAPQMHTQSPDLDKLVRCIGDALTGSIYVDDRQVCAIHCRREYTTEAERAEVTVLELCPKRLHESQFTFFEDWKA